MDGVGHLQFHRSSTPGSYSFQAWFTGTSNSKGQTYPKESGGCEPFAVTKYDPPTVTTVHESTGAVWTNKETAGAAAYDTTKVTTPAGAPTATGSVTYSFYSNGTCTSGGGNPAWTDTVTLSGGRCPSSRTTAALGAGSYSFSATYGGDTNYASQTGKPASP